jgi:MerR family transcriptional regulator, light-induced transcriptional regulator
MEFFTIKDLEKISGIKAHTIRIWEKRYQLIEPERLDNNRRVYSELEFKRFMKISALYKMGYKPSRIRDLGPDDIQNILTEDNENIFIENMIDELKSFNLLEIEKLIYNIIDRPNLEQAYFEFIVPLLTQVGKMWSVDQLNILHEHLLSATIKNALTHRSQKHRVNTSAENYSKKLILFLPESERHEIPLLFAYTILKEENFQIFYFGSDTPDNSLVQMKELNPDALVTFFVNFKNDNVNESYLKTLHNLLPDTFIFHNIHVKATELVNNKYNKTLTNVSEIKFCLR